MNLEKRSKTYVTKPQACFLVQSVFGTAFAYLTSGVYLSGLAILMGAGDVLVSYLSVIINICGVLILAFAAFLERFQSRKRLAAVLTILSRLATLFIVLIPVLVPENLRLTIFITTVIAAFTLQAQTTVVLNQWMVGFIDERASGRFVSMRQTLTLTVTVAFSLAGGYWMDFMQGQYLGFAVLFAAAALMGIFEILQIVSIPDNSVCHPNVHKGSFYKLAVLPLSNRSFIGFVFYIFTFYLLLNISDSFTTVYMMKYLALPYRTVTAMYMIISLPQLFLLGIFGKISDRRGHAFVLKTSVWLFAGETLFMFFASPESCMLFIPAAFLVASVANAGFVVAVFNRRYELIPEENRIVYDNFYTAAIGVGFILGPMAGGAIKIWLADISSLISVVPFADIRLLYIISTVGILLLQVFYTKAERKRGEGQCLK